MSLEGSRVLFLLLLIIQIVFCGVPIVVPQFSCPPLPTPPAAKDGKHVRPGNIKAIMAMGDSITAGFAMLGIPPTDFLEWRDWGYSTGGREGATTLANWLLNYSPNLQGLSYEPTLPLTPGKYLDAAISMARVEQLPDQVGYLIEQLQTTYSGTVDFDNDWKLLTLFIGANNLCDACRPWDERGRPEFFEEHLRIVLKLVDQHIPKVFVNLVTIFNISGVWDAGQTSDYCELLWDGLTNGECGCLLTGNATDRLAMDINSVLFNEASERVAKEMSAISDDFNVVVQPGLSDINIGKMGEIYLSGLDCFHPSLLANEAFTYVLWNNMFTPPGHKATWPDPYNVTIKCPTADDYLQ